MDRLVDGLRTKSAKIRALDKAGYSRPEIAKFLGISNQHVRNVLVRAAAPVAEQVKAKIGPGGRIVIPAAFRQAMKVGEGDDVVLRLDEGGVRVVSPASSVKRAQEIVRRHVPKGVRLSEELIAERRAEVRRETPS